MTGDLTVNSRMLFAVLPCSVAVSSMSGDDAALLVVISVILTLSVTLFPMSK